MKTKMVSLKVTHGYYNIIGFIAMEAAMHLANNWTLSGCEVEVGNEVYELTKENMVEVRVLSGNGRYTSVYVAAKRAVEVAKRLVKALDREVIFSIAGKELARFDLRAGRPVVRRTAHKSQTLMAA